MSHTMNIETEITDIDCLKEACERLGIRCEKGTHRLFNTRETGHGVFLEGWKYPAVVKANGQIAYDTYGGRWGNDRKLSELKAVYGFEKAKVEARLQGHSVYEIETDNKNLLQLKIAVNG